MFHAFGGDQLISQLFDVGGLATDSQDFQTIVMIQMAM
jgi:hypothetical protein